MPILRWQATEVKMACNLRLPDNQCCTLEPGSVLPGAANRGMASFGEKLSL